MALFSAAETIRRVRRGNGRRRQQHGRLRDLIALELRILRRKLRGERTGR